MSNSQITVRVPDSVKVLWKQMADKDGRSMSKYLERLLLREISNSEDLFENKIENFSENKKRNPKKTAYDAWELVDGQEICTKDNWDNWITHLHNLGIHLNYYAGGIQFNKLKDIWYADKDCDLIINYIIKQGHGKLYIPNNK